MPWRCGGTQSDYWNNKGSRPKNIHIHEPKLASDEANGLFRGSLGLLPGCKNFIFLKLVQRRSVSTIRLGAAIANCDGCGVMSLIIRSEAVQVCKITVFSPKLSI